MRKRIFLSLFALTHFGCNSLVATLNVEKENKIIQSFSVERTLNMKKPKKIDQDASFVYDNWHKGTLTDDGKPKGNYTIWDLEGIMLYDIIADDDGNFISYKSYYPDGSVGRDLVYDAHLNTSKVVYKSYHKEHYEFNTPLHVGDNRYAEKIYEGKISVDCVEFFSGSADGVRFFNNNRELISTFEEDNYTSLIDKFKQKSSNESWHEALDRLHDFSTAFKKQLAIDDIEETDYLTVSFDKSVTKDDFEKAEKRLGVIFPSSYKSFVLDNGLIKFGEKEPRFQAIEQRMLHPDEINDLDYMLHPALMGEFDNYFTLPIEKRKRITCFFRDQLDIQYEGWIAFDLTPDDYQNECNLISGIGCENLDGFDNKVGKPIDENLKTIDVFISNYVNKILN